METIEYTTADAATAGPFDDAPADTAIPADWEACDICHGTGHYSDCIDPRMAPMWVLCDCEAGYARHDAYWQGY